MDMTRWRRLAMVALFLVAATTVPLAMMLGARYAAMPDESPRSPETASVSANADEVTAGLPTTAPADKALASPVRPRAYSTIDVRTLAEARAYGTNPAPTPPAIDEATDASLVGDPPPAPSVVPGPVMAVAPESTGPSRPRQASTPRPTARPPVLQQAQDRTRVAGTPERALGPRVDTRTPGNVVRISNEPARASELPADAPRQRQHDASSDLDAAWERREQWMRDRLRQR